MIIKKTFAELNTTLIKHYDCFNRERFFLDAYEPEQGFVCVQTSSISDTCPIRLCSEIAKFVKKNIESEKFKFIYVGPYAFKTDKLKV